MDDGSRAFILDALAWNNYRQVTQGNLIFLFGTKVN